jgi:hypothetical protein
MTYFISFHFTSSHFISLHFNLPSEQGGQPLVDGPFLIQCGFAKIDLWLFRIPHCSPFTLVRAEQTFKIEFSKKWPNALHFKTIQHFWLLLIGFNIVSLSILGKFISTLEGNEINLTVTNDPEPQQLSDEFGLTEIAGRLSEFRS